MELLSPAGYYKCVESAIDSGADAVYLGCRALPHMRSTVFNFSDSEIKKALNYCHDRGRKIYLTFNSPYFDYQLPVIKKSISKFHSLGVDAFIISDIGLINDVRLMLPDSKIHVSIQAGACNRSTVKFFESLGANRITLERTVSIKEAKDMKKTAKAEMEMFVFGPQCYSYDSLCYMGQYFDGVCCRNKCLNKWSSNKKIARHLFMKYYNGISLLPGIFDAKIDSIKIEGRTRNSNFVSSITAIYRKAIDQYQNTGKLTLTKELTDKMNKLALFFEQTNGFLEGNYRRIKTINNFSFRSKLEYFSDIFGTLLETGALKQFKEESKLAADLDIGYYKKDIASKIRT